MSVGRLRFRTIADAADFVGPAANGGIAFFDASGNMVTDAAGLLFDPSIDTLTVGQIVVADAPIPVASGGTGGATAAAARTALGLDIGTDIQAWDAGLDDIAGLSQSADVSIFSDGVNWVSKTPSAARSALGLGSIATQAASAVAITGGSVTGITDLAIVDGGTGASTAGDARTNLGLGTMATQAASAVAVTGGTVDGAVIGNTTPAAGTFTTLLGADIATTGAGAFQHDGTGGFVIQNSSPGTTALLQNEFGASHLLVNIPTSAPADGDVGVVQATFYQSEAADILAVKFKDSGGNVFDHVLSSPRGYGEIYLAGGSTAQGSIGTGYSQITGFTTDSIDAGDVTNDAAADELSADAVGDYEISFDLSITGATGSTVFTVAVHVDGAETHIRAELDTATDTAGRVSGRGLVNIGTAPVDIDLRIKADSGASNSITPVHGSLVVKKLSP